MTKIDLITGFLGSGKTTFLKLYASYFLQKGEKLGILENDYGAVNVDMMLLADIASDNCVIETVAGACDADCHKRRFKTKLIAMGMCGYDRVIVEPSGIFDTDEFFDTLREEPLDRWYETGSVVAVVDPTYNGEWSPQSKSLLASQCAGAGAIVLSKTQLASEKELQSAVKNLNDALSFIKCGRDISGIIISKNWDDFSAEDFEKLSKSGYYPADYIKLPLSDDGYKTLYFMDLKLSRKAIAAAARKLFTDLEYGNIFRIKGFYYEDGQWYEFNSTKNQTKINPVPKGQDVVIVIGEKPDKERISRAFV